MHIFVFALNAGLVKGLQVVENITVYHVSWCKDGTYSAPKLHFFFYFVKHFGQPVLFV